MAQYKTIPYEKVEHTEIARKSYLEYERHKDVPDEAETEADWMADRERLRRTLNILTPQQREVFIMKVAYLMTEAEIAKKLNIAQQNVSRRFHRAQAALAKYIDKTTGKKH